jgi:hypothetical protein
MADLKISQLPSVTTLDPNDVFPVVDAGLTKQVSVTNLNGSLPITTFVRGASALWGGGLIASQYAFSGPYIPGVGNDNLTNNADNFPRWNTEVFNTDPNTFELFNSNTTLSRVLIKSPGYYLIVSQPQYFDLYNNMQMTVKLFSSASSSGGMAYVLRLASRWYVGVLIPPGQTIDSTAIFYVSAPTFYTVSLNPTLNTPYPSDSGSSPSRFTLIKLLAAG